MNMRRGPIHRLLYRPSRNIQIPMWRFYLLAPIYAVHYFLSQVIFERYSLWEAAKETMFGYRLIRSHTIWWNKYEKKRGSST